MSNTARARAVCAVSRSDLGRPLDRLHGSPALLGVPGPAATQWDQIETGGDGGSVGCAYLERLAAPGELISQDDTSVRMLALRGAHRQMRAAAEALGCSRPTERPGMSPTAVGVKGGAHTIGLEESGRAQAGETLAAL